MIEYIRLSAWLDQLFIWRKPVGHRWATLAATRWAIDPGHLTRTSIVIVPMSTVLPECHARPGPNDVCAANGDVPLRAAIKSNPKMENTTLTIVVPAIFLLGLMRQFSMAPVGDVCLSSSLER